MRTQGPNGLLIEIIPRTQQRALLYRLAATLEPVAREHLCFLFWPDTGDDTVLRRLTQSL